MIRRGRNGLLDDLLLVCHALHLLIIIPAPLPARFAQPRIFHICNFSMPTKAPGGQLLPTLLRLPGTILRISAGHNEVNAPRHKLILSWEDNWGSRK
jgi:hypothetical protein